MKTITTLVIITIITLAGVASFLQALDRSVFPGCTVIDQVGDHLKIRLDPEFITGTDHACERAERLIDRIRQQGYSVSLVRESSDQWLPTVAPIE